MKLSEVKDMVREHVGRDKISDPALDYAVQRGLRRLEQRDNWYWMEANRIFEIDEDQANPQEYVLLDYNIVDFKEVDQLFVSDRTQTDPTWETVQGPVEVKDTKQNFTEGDEGKPAFFSLMDDEENNPRILIWPPVPDQDYRAHLFYYKWTTLPSAATSSAHEVLRRWPDALIALATEQAILISTKDMEAASYWAAQFEHPNQLIQSEYKRIKLYQAARKQPSRPNTSSSSGSSTLTERLRAAERRFF
jgi:hypothetical protein